MITIIYGGSAFLGIGVNGYIIKEDYTKVFSPLPYFDVNYIISLLNILYFQHHYMSLRLHCYGYKEIFGLHFYFKIFFYSHRRKETKQVKKTRTAWCKMKWLSRKFN